MMKTITKIIIERDEDGNVYFNGELVPMPFISADQSLTFLPTDVCKHCQNNPLNGGTGICHCTLGNQTFY